MSAKDDVAEFLFGANRSELYFKVLSMLGIFADWIQETLHDLEGACRGMEEVFYQSEEKRELEFKNKEFLEGQRQSFGVLFERIERKRTEITTLRDGVSEFNILMISLGKRHELMRSSFSTPSPSGKPLKRQNKADISWCSP